MPAAATASQLAASSFPQRKRWTREEYFALQQSGLVELRRVELIRGDLIERPPVTRPQALAWSKLMRWLHEEIGYDYICQDLPIEVSPEDNPTTVPKPNAAVLACSMESLLDMARPPDIRMIVEVSGSSLHFDLTSKAELYAAAGIAEYWLLDVPAGRLIVHLDPLSSAYSRILVYSGNESVSPQFAPHSVLALSSVFLNSMA